MKWQGNVILIAFALFGLLGLASSIIPSSGSQSYIKALRAYHETPNEATKAALDKEVAKERMQTLVFEGEMAALLFGAIVALVKLNRKTRAKAL